MEYWTLADFFIFLAYHTSLSADSAHQTILIICCYFFSLKKSEYESPTSTTTSLVCCNHCISFFWTSVCRCNTKANIRISWPNGTFTTTNSSKCVSKIETFCQSEQCNEFNNFIYTYFVPAGYVLLKFPGNHAYNLEQKQGMHKGDILKWLLHWGLFMP